MIWVCLRRNSVAKIENQRTISKHLQDTINSIVKAVSSCHNAHRIKIALYRTILLQFSRKIERNRPIQPDRIGTGFLPIIFQQQACTFGKSDDLRLDAGL